MTNQQTVKFIGRKIAEARAELGLNQSAFGECIGSTMQQVQRWERGVYCVPLLRLLRIVRVTGLSIRFFLPTDDPTP
jgi:DNA-binding transcriptional regulator YiaG